MDSLNITYVRHNLKILKFFLASAKLLNKSLQQSATTFHLSWEYIDFSLVLPNLKVPDDSVNPGCRL
jgi:hypothetical protein